MKRGLIFTLLFWAGALFSQTNTWTQVGSDAGPRAWGALVYAPDSNRFLISMGWCFNGNWDPPSRYSELSLKLPDTRWINFLPDDSLYGIWADSTGVTTGLGNNFETPAFKTVGGYLRPGVYFSTHKAFYQYAYDSDNGCVYYYIANRTLRYNIGTRRWDTLSVPSHPTAYQGGTAQLIWGSLCYDPVNKEVVLFGGADVDARNGHCGTWTFSTASNTWTNRSSAGDPPPRCLSQMVYDAKHQSIILFGGDHLDKLFADTWVYECATRTWSQKSPVLSPSPRAGHAFLYLPKSQSVVLVGGYIYRPEDSGYPSYYTGYSSISPLEMWRYDLAANEWKLVKAFSSGESKPQWSFHTMMAADTGDRVVAVSDSGYGGWSKMTFVMDCDPTQTDAAGTLSQGVAPGTVGARGNAGDPAWYTQGVAAPNSDSLENVYRQMPVNTWIRMTPPRVPYAGRDWGTRVFDPDHDCMILWSGGHSAYCGSDAPQYFPHTNRWKLGYAPELMIELNGDGGNSGNYVNYFTFNNRPFMTGHSYRNYCYSSVHKKLIKHHPSKYTFTYDPVRMDWDTTRILNPAGDASGIYNASLSNTPHGAFGWLKMTQGCCNSYFAFYLLDASNTWKRLPVRGDTVIPTYYTEQGNGVYDSKRDRMLFVSTDEAGQVWAYSFKDSTFAKLNPTGSYSSSSNLWRESAYLPAQDKVLYMGNGDHRVYNCAANQWELLPVTKGTGVGTTASVSSGYAYDPNRDLVWDVEQNCEVYCLRVAGGFDPDTLPMRSGVLSSPLMADVFSAFPNPFHPSVLLTVGSSGALPVSVRVYDIQGRLAAVLMDRKVLHGKRVALRFDGLGSGVYVARKFVGGRCVASLKLLKVR